MICPRGARPAGCACNINYDHAQAALLHVHATAGRVPCKWDSLGPRYRTAPRTVILIVSPWRLTIMFCNNGNEKIYNAVRYHYFRTLQHKCLHLKCIVAYDKIENFLKSGCCNVIIAREVILQFSMINNNTNNCS